MRENKWMPRKLATHDGPRTIQQVLITNKPDIEIKHLKCVDILLFELKSVFFFSEITDNSRFLLLRNRL